VPKFGNGAAMKEAKRRKPALSTRRRLLSGVTAAIREETVEPIKKSAAERMARYLVSLLVPRQLPGKKATHEVVTAAGLQGEGKPWSAILSTPVENSPFRRSHQTLERKAQNKRSAPVSFGRFRAERFRTPIWWQRATCSNSSAARERHIEPNVERTADNKISIG
jgi:hypothetical protein